MDLETLIADVRSLIDEEDVTAGFWTDVSLTRWINQGNIDLARRLENLEDTESSNVVALTPNYNLPTDCIKIRRVTYNSRALYPIEYETLNDITADGSGELTETGTPTNFYIFDNDIWLYPVPSASLALGLKIWYYKRPATLTNTVDTPEQPEQYHYLISLFAFNRALLKDTLDTTAMRIMDMYLKGVEEAKGELRRDQKVQMKQISFIDE